MLRLDELVHLAKGDVGEGDRHLSKEQALQKLAPVEGQLSRFTADDPLLAFLTSL